MKIVHVVDFHSEHLGYEPTYLAQAQKNLGHEVSIVTSDLYVAEDGSQRKRKGYYKHDGIATYRLSSVAFIGKRLWLVGLRRLLLQLSPDVVHQHGTVNITGVRVASFQRRAGYGLICDCHAAYFNTRDNGLLHSAAYFLFRHTAGRLIKSRARVLTAIGENEQTFLCRALGLPSADVPIVRLGVDTNLFKFSATDRLSLRARLGYSADDTVMIHVGSVRPGKRLDLLLRVVQSLRDSQLKIKALLVAIGTVDAVAALRSNVALLGLENHVHVTDYLMPSELPAYYSAADIAVWPGDISIAALEAIAVGLPLIGIDDPYVRHITNRGNGFTFSRGSETDLLDKSLSLARDPQLRSQCGHRSRQLAIDELAWEKIADKYLQLYESTLEQTRVMENA